MAGLDYQRARAFIAAVPRGRWTAFKDVAEAAGSPGAALPIGGWLFAEGRTVASPWRVLYANGSVPPGYYGDAPGVPRNAAEVRARLEEEGVRFTESHKASPDQHFRVEDWTSAAPASAGSISQSPRPPPPAGIQLGATVRALDVASGRERTWTLVDPSEVDAAAGRVSVESPVGRALIGRSIGDIVTVSAPAGDRRYRILDAEPYTPPEQPRLDRSDGIKQSPLRRHPSGMSPVDLTSEVLARATSESPSWLPARIAHADWGTNHSKCVVATAELDDGIYHAHPPRAVLGGHGLIERMRLVPRQGQSTLLGFDFPLGVPRAYAQKAGIVNFAGWFRELDLASTFFDVASDIDEVSTARPFSRC